MAGSINKRGLLQVAGVLLLLVVLPLVSWYYLSTGLDYRLQAREELKPIAEIPDMRLRNYDGQQVALSRFEDQVLIGHFFSGAQQERYLELLSKLHGQFGERKEVLFLNFSADTSLEMNSRAQQMMKDHMLVDQEQVFFLMNPGVQELAETLRLPVSERSMSLENNSLLFFADSMVVKQYYDFTQPEEVKKLIKHITLNLHPDEEEDIIFERETEK